MLLFPLYSLLLLNMLWSVDKRATLLMQLYGFSYCFRHIIFGLNGTFTSSAKANVNKQRQRAAPALRRKCQFCCTLRKNAVPNTVSTGGVHVLIGKPRQETSLLSYIRQKSRCTTIMNAKGSNARVISTLFANLCVCEYNAFLRCLPKYAHLVKNFLVS